MILTPEFQREVLDNINNIPIPEDLFFLDFVGAFQQTDKDAIQLNEAATVWEIAKMIPVGDKAEQSSYPVQGAANVYKLGKLRRMMRLDKWFMHTSIYSKGSLTQLIEMQTKITNELRRRINLLLADIITQFKSISYTWDIDRFPDVDFGVDASMTETLAGTDRWNGGSSMNPAKDIGDMCRKIRIATGGARGAKVPLQMVISSACEAYLMDWFTSLTGDLLRTYQMTVDYVLREQSLPTTLWGLSKIIVTDGYYETVNLTTGATTSVRYSAENIAAIHPTNPAAFIKGYRGLTDEYNAAGNTYYPAVFSKVWVNNDPGTPHVVVEDKIGAILSGIKKLGRIIAW